MDTFLTFRQSMLLNPMLAGLALLAGLASMSSCGEVHEGLHIISNNEDIVESYQEPRTIEVVSDLDQHDNQKATQDTPKFAIGASGPQ